MERQHSFRSFIEGAAFNIDSIWDPMKIRRIGSVQKSGKSSPLFWHYMDGEYIVGDMKEDKSPLTFYSPREITRIGTYKTLEQLGDDGYSVSRLGFVHGPPFI